MSRSFLWELEKLRHEFGVSAEEIREAAKALDRKRRGAKPYSDDRHLAQMRAGASARAVATSIGGRGAAATEVRISRKNRKATLRSEYWKRIEELADLLAKMMTSPAELDKYTQRLIKVVGPPSAPHLIMLDIAICSLQRVLDGNRLSAEDRDHLQRARFHATRIDRIDLDNPVRFEALSSRIAALEAILRELRARKT